MHKMSKYITPQCHLGYVYLYRGQWLRKHPDNKSGWYVTGSELGHIRAKTLKELRVKVDELKNSPSIKFILE
jgi:hypothetical protein